MTINVDIKNSPHILKQNDLSEGLYFSELLDEVTIDSFNKYSKEFNHQVAPTLFLEFHGGENEVKEQVKATG